MTYLHENSESIALQESRCWTMHTPDGIQLFVNEDLDAANWVIDIEKSMKKLGNSSEPLFSIRESKHLPRRIHGTDFGNLLIKYAEETPFILKHFPLHCPSPSFELLANQWRKSDIGHTYQDLRFLSGFELDEVVEKLNKFIEAMRMVVKGDDFKMLQKNFRRSARKNYLQIMRYFKACFAKRNKLLIIWLDLSYLQQPDQYNKIDITGETQIRSIDQIKSDRTNFFNYLRKTFGKHVIGSVWHWEYGLFKGHHFHTVILLDGQFHREGVTIAKILGEYWAKNITDGAGNYFNNNVRQKSQRFCALGVHKSDDATMWQGFHHMANYLTKPDGYIRLELPDGSRTLGKGKMPEVSEKRLGRPRKSN